MIRRTFENVSLKNKHPMHKVYSAISELSKLRFAHQDLDGTEIDEDPRDGFVLTSHQESSAPDHVSMFHGKATHTRASGPTHFRLGNRTLDIGEATRTLTIELPTKRRTSTYRLHMDDGKIEAEFASFSERLNKAKPDPGNDTIRETVKATDQSSSKYLENRLEGARNFRDEHLELLRMKDGSAADGDPLQDSVNLKDGETVLKLSGSRLLYSSNNSGFYDTAISLPASDPGSSPRIGSYTIDEKASDSRSQLHWDNQAGILTETRTVLDEEVFLHSEAGYLDGRMHAHRTF